MRLHHDPYDEFKKYFTAIVREYNQDPTDRKEAKLHQVITSNITNIPELLAWFNAMFKCRTTISGLSVTFKVGPPSIPS
jgi:hypothetical protein